MKKEIVSFIVFITVTLLISAFNPLGVSDKLTPFLDSFTPIDYAIALSLFILFLYVSVWIHELGHALFATIAGIRVKKIQIGISDPLVEITVVGVRFVIAKGIGGYVALANPPETWLKSRLFINMAGGVSANLFAAILTISIFEINLFELFSVEDLTSRAAIGFAIINLYLFAVNLLPMTIFNYGFLAFSDGQQLLRIPGCGPTEIADALAAGDVWNGYEKIIKNDYPGAEEIFLDITKNYPESRVAKINLGVAYIKQAKIAETGLLLQQIDNDQTPEHYRALVWNNLAWTYLIEGSKESIRLASEHSDKSLSVLSGMPLFKSVKGAVLLELGDIKEGMSFLENINVRALTPHKKDRVTHFAYLAYGYWMQNNTRKVKYLSRQVDEHYEIADADHKMIIDRLRKKSNDFGRGDSGSSDFIAP